MNGGPSGFNNAPVTKTFVIVSAIFTLFFGIQGRFSKLGLSYEDIFRNFRLWKLIVSGFSFSSAPELMFGLYLLYYFRVFERQIGSNKYSVFIVFSITLSLLFEVLTLALLKDPSNALTSGPYGLIFASFVPFYFDIPVSSRFRVFGVRFSDKSFIYLAGLQLLLSSWKRSILPGICGILTGLLYRLNVLRIRKAKFPEFVASFFSRLSWPSIGSSPAAPTRNVVGSMPSYTGRQVEVPYSLPSCSFSSPPKGHSLYGRWKISALAAVLLSGHLNLMVLLLYDICGFLAYILHDLRSYPSPMTATIEPPEDSIAMLVSMGFDRNSARQALVQARNDINAATNILLEAQSH